MNRRNQRRLASVLAAFGFKTWAARIRKRLRATAKPRKRKVRVEVVAPESLR